MRDETRLDSGRALFDRTAKVHVDHVKPGLDQFERPGRKLLRFGPHQLTADGVFVRVNIEEVFRFLPFAQGEQKLVQHHFANRITRPVATSDHSHRKIAVS